MADTLEAKQIEDLKANLASLRNKNKDLEKRLEEKNNFINEVLNYSDMAIVEFTPDFRIINADGALKRVFGDYYKKVERGENLMRIVYKSTNSIKEKTDDTSIPYDEREDIEKAVEKFMQSKREERDVEIVGEDENGDVFLLTWKIVRNNKNFKSYFKIIPTNNIIKSTQELHKKELAVKDSNIKQIFNYLNEGIILLDLKYKITYMNEAAKKTIISSKIPLLQDAPVEGRFFREIFVHEETEDINQRLDYLDQAIETKSEVKYVKKTRDVDVEFTINLMIRDSGTIDGLILLISPVTGKVKSSSAPDPEKLRLLHTLKKLSDEKNVLSERVKELEYNHQWFMKKRREDNEQNKALHKSVRTLYKYLTYLPIPVSIMNYPNLNYEFINRAYEVMFNLSKKDINGKTDNDIMAENESYVLTDKAEESIALRHLTTTNVGGVTIKQIPIFDDEENPTHIIRIYEE